MIAGIARDQVVPRVGQPGIAWDRRKLDYCFLRTVRGAKKRANSGCGRRVRRRGVVGQVGKLQRSHILLFHERKQRDEEGNASVGAGFLG